MKILICLAIYLFFPGSLQAQYYFYNDKYRESAFLFELGASAGLINCLTDLGGKKGVGKKFIKDLNFKNFRPGYSIYGGIIYKNILALRFEGTIGTITAYDSILKNVKATTNDRYERNLSFKSNITDLHLAAEIHPFFGPWVQENPPLLTPYLVGGIGFFYFNPQAKLNGKWYDLQPLHTEGQAFAGYPNKKPYSLKQMNIPLGAGIKYEISAIFNARLEIIYRILRTDYLDDVSTVYTDPALFKANLPPGQAIIAIQLADRQGELISGHITTPGTQRGNARNNDAFFSIQLKLGIIVNRAKNFK